MRRKQNVILFSAGESARNGKLDFIKTELGCRDICCQSWQELFQSAHHTDQIALLPALLKKIPTFDFALIFAEAVDELNMRKTEHYKAMRDNVVFELGMCTMALGTDRVILLSEESVRLPDDLMGIGKLGVEQITYVSEEELVESVARVGRTIWERTAQLKRELSDQVDAVVGHIARNADVVSPIFVGAAVASAEAYFMNFIVRLIENAHKGFCARGCEQKKWPFPENWKLQIVFPTRASSIDREKIADYYRRRGLDEYVVEDAGPRGLFFRGTYREAEKTLTVVDVPTSVTASYSVVQSILNIDSDDEYDSSAEDRFINKEMDVYGYSLRKLFTPQVAETKLSVLGDKGKRDLIIAKLQEVEFVRADIGS